MWRLTERSCAFTACALTDAASPLAFDRGCPPDRALAGFVIVLVCMTEIGRELAEARASRPVRGGALAPHEDQRADAAAIERNQMGNLPGGIYTRGLLRACAGGRLRSGSHGEPIPAEVGEDVDALQVLDRMATAANGSRVVERLHSSEIDAADRRRAMRNTALFVVLLLARGAFYFAGIVSITGRRSLAGRHDPPGPWRRTSRDR